MKTFNGLMFSGLTFFLLLLVTLSPVRAELRTTTSDAFGADSVSLDFSKATLLSFIQGSGERPEATDLLADWGIGLAGSQGVNPKVTWWTPKPPPNVLPHYDFIAELAADNDEKDPILVLNSVHPLTRIGLNLANDSEGDSGGRLPVTFTAQDAAGAELGRIETTIPRGSSFVVLEDSSQMPFSRVTVDYGDGEPEKLLGVQMDFVDRPVFKTYLAHIGDGKLPNGESLRSSIVITNLSTSTAEGSLEFFDDEGEPLDMYTDPGIWQNRIDFAIPGRSSANWTTAGFAFSIKTGSAHITTNVPVSAAIRFSSFHPNQEVIAEAGIASSGAEQALLAPVSKRSFSGVIGGAFPIPKPYSTAIAIANLTDEPVEIRLRGPLGGSEVVRELPARGHLAEFVEELFPVMEDVDLDGVVQIWASHPIAVTVLHTRDGYAHASLPATGRLK